MIIQTKILSANQFSQINQMWNDAYPMQLKDRFPILLDEIQNFNHYIIEDAKYNIMAWAVVFEKENEIRFSIIVNAQYKGKGLGSLLVEKLKAENDLLYGWVIDHNNDLKSNGEHYQAPLPFYLKNDFEILYNNRIESEMIKAVKIKWCKK